MRKKKKNINRTRYGDYSSNSLNYEEKKVHNLIYGLVSLITISYITYSGMNGQATLPFHSGNMYLNGIAMYTLFGSLTFMIIGFFLPVFEFYARRKNFHVRNLISKQFFSFKKWTKVLSWSLFILSIVIGLLNDNMTK